MPKGPWTSFFLALLTLHGGPGGCFSAQEPIQTPAAEPAAMTIVTVAPDTKVLEEKTLQMMPALSQAALSKMNIKGGTWKGKESSYAQMGDGWDSENAMRLYGFTLEPSERLVLTLKSENSGKMWLRFASPVHTDAMTGEVLAANRTPKPLRSSRLAIRNVTEKRYPIILMLYGEAGYYYRLEIARTVK